MCHESDWASDDLTGKQLSPTEVYKARLKKCCQGRGVVEKVPVSKCFETTGKAPIGVRWIDHNKGDDVNPNIRCRFVAQEYNKGKEDGLFAGTPPLEAMKILIRNHSYKNWSRKVNSIIGNKLS